jgi:hypothetical protein
MQGRKNIELIMSVRLSVRPHGTIRLPLDRFSGNLSSFGKMYRENSSFIKNMSTITGTFHDDLRAL